MRHFYHAWADGHWHRPLAEHLAALDAAGLHPEMTVGIIGSLSARAEVKAALPPGCLFIEADEGFEEITLQALASWARQAGREPVLYAHTKGALHDLATARVWRRSMTKQVVGRWRECVELLGENDAVGCHWLTPSGYPGLVTSPYFGGNFWWARADYLARLPEPRPGWAAEGWVGQGNPQVFDLKPGFPSLALFAEEILELGAEPGAYVRGEDMPAGGSTWAHPPADEIQEHDPASRTIFGTTDMPVRRPDPPRVSEKTAALLRQVPGLEDGE